MVSAEANTVLRCPQSDYRNSRCGCVGGASEGTRELMPAHARAIITHQCGHPGCGADARNEVYDTFNGLVGWRCIRHTKPLIDQLNKARDDMLTANEAERNRP